MSVLASQVALLMVVAIPAVAAAWGILSTPSASLRAGSAPGAQMPVEQGRPPLQTSAGAGGHYIEQTALRPSEWRQCYRPGCESTCDHWAWEHSGYEGERFCSPECAEAMSTPT